MKRLAVLLAIGTTLTACVSDPLPAPPPPTATLQQQVAAPASPVAAPAAVTAAAAVVEPAPAPPPQVAIVVPPPPVRRQSPLAPPTLTPAELIGKSRTDVVARLGQPDTARAEAGAEVLLYQGQGCVLFVFVYPPLAGGEPNGVPRAEHAEVGPANRDVSRDAACLTGLLQRVAVRN